MESWLFIQPLPPLPLTIQPSLSSYLDSPPIKPKDGPFQVQLFWEQPVGRFILIFNLYFILTLQGQSLSSPRVLTRTQREAPPVARPSSLCCQSRQEVMQISPSPPTLLLTITQWRGGGNHRLNLQAGGPWLCRYQCTSVTSIITSEIMRPPKQTVGGAQTESECRSSEGSGGWSESGIGSITEH